MRSACIFVVLLASPLYAQQEKPPRLDALGDPLPPQAIHRFGTSRFCTQAEVLSLVAAQDSKLIAAADREGRVYLWNAATGRPLLRTRTDSGKRVALSPDGQWLASGEEFPFELRKTNRLDEPMLPIGTAPRVFVFAPDSKAIAISMMEDTAVTLLDVPAGKELRRFAGLDGTISAMAFSPDGKLFAAAAPVPEAQGEKPAIRIVVWDAQTGDKKKDWQHPGKQAQQLAFLPDNKTLLGLFAARLAAYDTTTGQRLAKVNQLVGSAFALDRAGKRLATTDGPKVFDFATSNERHDFESAPLLRHLAMSGDGKLLVASPARLTSASPRLLLFDLAQMKPRRVPEEHSHFVDAVAFSHDGLKIATASNVEGVARVWDARTSKLLNVLNLNRLVAKQSGGPRIRSTLLDGLAFAPSNAELFVAGQRWSLDKSEPIKLDADDDFRFDQTNSRRAVLSPDGHLAASFLADQAIQFWDPAKARPIQKIEMREEYGRGMWTCLAFSPNGKYAVTGKLIPRRMDDETPPDESIYLWEIATGKLLKKLRPAPGLVTRIQFSPDGETLAVISLPTKLEFWHWPSGRLLRETPLADLEDLPRVFALPTVAFAPHGQWIAFTFKEGEIVLVETITGKEIHTLRGHLGYVSSLAFSPDNRRLLSGGRDTTALLWSVIPQNPTLPPAWKDADQLWLQLGGPPTLAYKVAWALMAHPDRAIEVIGKRLEPDSGATDKEIRALIKNLSAPKFAQRDKAITRLKQIGVRAFPALEQSLKSAPDLETTRRIRDLLRTVETALTPETLRDLRSLQILEMIGTPQARAILTQIATGDAGAAKTRLAQGALERGKKSSGH